MLIGVLCGCDVSKSILQAAGVLTVLDCDICPDPAVLMSLAALPRFAVFSLGGTLRQL